MESDEIVKWQRWPSWLQYLFISIDIFFIILLFIILIFLYLSTVAINLLPVFLLVFVIILISVYAIYKSSFTQTQYDKGFFINYIVDKEMFSKKLLDDDFLQFIYRKDFSKAFVVYSTIYTFAYKGQEIFVKIPNEGYIGVHVSVDFPLNEDRYLLNYLNYVTTTVNLETDRFGLDTEKVKEKRIF